MARIGSDISHHQEGIDLVRAKPHVHFVFLKATDGTSFIDKTFGTRWQKLAQLAIPRGAYHFARPGNAADQAAHFVDVVKQNGFRAGDVAILDVEDPTDDPNAWVGTSPQQLRALVDRFIANVRRDLPVEDVVLYTGLPFWRDRMGSPATLPARSIGWLTRYRAAGPYGGNFPRPAAWPDPPDIWQFTDGAVGDGKPEPRDIPGIGKVDCNQMTEACFKRLFAVSLPPPVPKFPGILRPGATGDGVKQVQQNLNRFLKPAEKLTVNGNFDTATKTKLEEWQRNRLIQNIGVVGPGTWEMLNAPVFTTTLKLNSTGTAVKQLKVALNKFGNQLDTNDPLFDRQTEQVVKNWQEHRGQRLVPGVAGVVDMLTWFWIHTPSGNPPELHPG